jgi:hypothetical protein
MPIVIGVIRFIGTSLENRIAIRRLLLKTLKTIIKYNIVS